MDRALIRGYEDAPLPSPPDDTPTALVCGGTGFLGRHLVRALKQRGYWVRAVDCGHAPDVATEANEREVADLRRFSDCQRVTRGMGWVFQTAALVGGLGYIHDGSHARIAHDNALVNLNLLEAASRAGVRRYLFTSSAVVYPQYRQTEATVTPLREDEVMPADPAEGGYGWEKLFTEQLCRYYREEGLLETRVARLHNTFGPGSVYCGGREKSVAAICRKVLEAKASGSHTVPVWGSGEQTRSYLYVDDCVEGLLRLMASNEPGPLNLDSERLVTINELAYIVAGIVGWPVELEYVDGPVGVMGRAADLTRLRAALGWEPQVSLEDGLRETVRWIEQQMGLAVGSAAA